ncbi:MAG: hypothetical protein KBS69_05990 [Bacteroidales bacterium]|nr:hypothetical protein [Candidatus Colicola caccequi]
MLEPKKNTTMMNIDMNNPRKRKIIIRCTICAGIAYLGLLVFLFTQNDNKLNYAQLYMPFDGDPAKPGVVANRANHPARSTVTLRSVSVSLQGEGTAAPSYTFQTSSKGIANVGSGDYRLHTSSSADVKSIGGGGSYSGGAGATTGNAAWDAAASVPTPMFMAPMIAQATPQRDLGAQSTMQAEQAIIEANSPMRYLARPHTVHIDDNPEEPFPDIVPVGDVPWIMMILLCAALAYVRARSRKYNKELEDKA